MKIRATLLLALLAACGPAATPSPPSTEALGDDAAASAPLTWDDGGDPDGNAVVSFDPPWEGSAPIDDGDAGGGTPPSDAPTLDPWTAPDAPVPAAPQGACTQPLTAGDLAITELMIESVAGAGDYGEWVEIQSTLPCTANVRGIHGETSDGAKIRTFDVGADLWITPGGTLVVADSSDPTLDHDLPGVVLTWTGHPGDVLRNQGGTLTLQSGTTIIASVTWPTYKLEVGASLELPADCPPGGGTDVGLWKQAVVSWFPGFFGTPNAPNVDVSCQ
jgi:hypothetical protein